MPQVNSTTVSLRFSGGEDHDEIASIIGVTPTRIERKGQPRVHGRKINESGCWIYSLEFISPGNLNAQIAKIFEKTTKDNKSWLSLSKKYDAYLFIGIFHEEINEEIGLSAETLKCLAERHLRIYFDIYYQGDCKE
ncbi:MAG: DUF4279 domain-containing protein [Alphaproteobacteria bacterium]|nr:DUF4279 domain-containing protein [Alphaproteobacteria bacterium]MBP7759406.1 DUF4279 domain-containing protein [Alphaproteobacteria bacterium]MBP7762683.1 DUF4279 domain-containing protein [Alphaproteobacteria bacterium]MBP7905666.1 DUF4279 domain-containing protein [Alphaproteobacteria bacterium]